MLMTTRLRRRLIETLTRMITDAKERFDQENTAFGQESKGGYSPEVIEAEAVLEKLQEG